MTPAALSDAARTEALRHLSQDGRPDADELDVLVVGGGVVGAGCALDAATRGLRERGLLLQRLAPHLVRPVSFLYPLKHKVWERAYVGAGIFLYDALAASSGKAAALPRHRHLTRRGARRLAPDLRPDALVGAIRYSDAQVDDARHTMEVVRTAATYGAHVANRARVVTFLREGERVVGARVRDEATGAEIDVRARQVINATGVWTDETQEMVGRRGRLRVRSSKGVHLVVPEDRISSTTGLILRTATSVLFVIPWGRHWIVGTTDTDWALDKAHPAATAADIDYLLSQVNQVLLTPLTRDDVEGVYAGLRPLLSGESDSTSQLSREHTVAFPAPGLVVVAGGKYTTYRVMAADAVDAAVQGLDRTVGPSVTADVPLVGAVGWPAVWNQRHLLARRSGLHQERVEHLLRRYGVLTEQVLDLVAGDPSLAEPLPGADDYLRAEVVYSTGHEGARHVDDLLTRRTRISIESWDRGLAAAEVVAELMGDVLGWSTARRRTEVERYRERVAAERASQQLPDDASADAARLLAREVALPG